MVNPHLVLGAGQKTVAIQNSERPVHLVEQGLPNLNLGAIHWDDLHLFKIVSSSSSFRQAAKKLKISVNTLRARVSRLEDTLGVVLFSRSRDGIALSSDGLAILDIALEMQTLTTQLKAGGGDNVVVEHGELRISCSEGLGEFWLTPKLASLQDLLPEHVVSLQNDFDQNRIHSREYDIRVGFIKPTDQEMIVRKLATIHMMMFASEQYLAKFGTPVSINEAHGHRFILQNAPGVHSEIIKYFIGDDATKRLTITKVNTSHSLYWAIVNGAGIGALPTYARSVSKRVRPLDLPFQLKFDLWLSFDRNVQNSKPVRQTIDWLIDCFDPVQYPWFAEDFIHPDDFEAKHEATNIISLFNLND
jgi:DNA-binding transcriptional LysR family regulator